jgi:hypothetical protein
VAGNGLDGRSSYIGRNKYYYHYVQTGTAVHPSPLSIPEEGSSTFLEKVVGYLPKVHMALVSRGQKLLPKIFQKHIYRIYKIGFNVKIKKKI